MSAQFRIGDRMVGGGNPALLVAEVAQAHDGSLGLAHSFVDAAADAGADAIKFQTHIAAAESTRREQFRVKFSKQDRTRYEYWKRMEFTAEQWRELAEHARSRDLLFLSSAFSVEALRLLVEIGVPAWKVASGEIRTRELLEPMLKSGAPLLVSTGMSPWPEIEGIVAELRAGGADFCLMQCTSKYPTALEQVGLNVMEEYRRRFGCAVGLSDHSGTPFPAMAAIARGCDVVELHLTFSAIAYCWTQALQYVPADKRGEMEQWFYEKHFRELMDWDEKYPRNLVREHTAFPVSFSIVARKRAA